MKPDSWSDYSKVFLNVSSCCCGAVNATVLFDNLLSSQNKEVIGTKSGVLFTFHKKYFKKGLDQDGFSE